MDCDVLDAGSFFPTAWLWVRSGAGLQRVSSLPPRLRSPGSFLSQVLNKASLTERPCYGLGFLGHLVVLGALLSQPGMYSQPRWSRLVFCRLGVLLCLIVFSLWFPALAWHCCAVLHWLCGPPWTGFLRRLLGVLSCQFMLWFGSGWEVLLRAGHLRFSLFPLGALPQPGRED